MKITEAKCSCTREIHKGKPCINKVFFYRGETPPEKPICPVCQQPFARGHE